MTLSLFFGKRKEASSILNISREEGGEKKKLGHFGGEEGGDWKRGEKFGIIKKEAGFVAPSELSTQAERGAQNTNVRRLTPLISIGGGKKGGKKIKFLKKRNRISHCRHLFSIGFRPIGDEGRERKEEKKEKKNFRNSFAGGGCLNPISSVWGRKKAKGERQTKFSSSNHFLKWLKRLERKKNPFFIFQGEGGDGKGGRY